MVEALSDYDKPFVRVMKTSSSFRGYHPPVCYPDRRPIPEDPEGVAQNPKKQLLKREVESKHKQSALKISERPFGRKKTTASICRRDDGKRNV